MVFKKSFFSTQDDAFACCCGSGGSSSSLFSSLDEEEDEENDEQDEEAETVRERDMEEDGEDMSDLEAAAISAVWTLGGCISLGSTFTNDSLVTKVGVATGSGFLPSTISFVALSR